MHSLHLWVMYSGRRCAVNFCACMFMHVFIHMVPETEPETKNSLLKIQFGLKGEKVVKMYITFFVCNYSVIYYKDNQTKNQQVLYSH